MSKVNLPISSRQFEKISQALSAGVAPVRLHFDWMNLPKGEIAVSLSPDQIVKLENAYAKQYNTDLLFSQKMMKDRGESANEIIACAYQSPISSLNTAFRSNTSTILPSCYYSFILTMSKINTSLGFHLGHLHPLLTMTHDIDITVSLPYQTIKMPL